MRELGPSSVALHWEGGVFAAKQEKLDYVLGVQGDAAQIVEGAVATGFPREKSKFFQTPAEAARFLVGFVQPGDLLLVKGSRSVKMERIVEALLAQFAPEDARPSSGAGH
jgi:UDP-N-acetylmuramoyl-tripeptide--D-alanyl-D-alanine ligase